MNLLEIHNLDFAWRDKLILQNIDLSVQSGAILGIIGPNGAGKTTLVKLILGLLEPTRGTIQLNGVDMSLAIARGEVIGYLPQTLSVDRNLPIDVRRLILTGLAGRTGLFRAISIEDRAFVDRLIDEIGLNDLAHRQIDALSGGQFQRALIARALAARPKLLVLDEPIVGIDRRGQEEFVTLIQKLRAEFNLTVIFVSHELRVVASLSDRIACLARTIHFHDIPQRMPADLMYQMFACDLATLGIRGGLPVCDDPNCDGHTAHARPSSNTGGLNAIEIQPPPSESQRPQ